MMVETCHALQTSKFGPLPLPTPTQVKFSIVGGHFVNERARCGISFTLYYNYAGINFSVEFYFFKKRLPVRPLLIRHPKIYYEFF
jgi:hypothetical protein